MLDYICYQKDHRPDNYFVKIINDSIRGIQAFDNDCPTTFFPIVDASFKAYSYSPLFNRNGINRPYISRSFLTSLNKLKKDEIENSLRCYLPKYCIFKTVRRIVRLKKIIHKSISANSLVVVDDQDYNANTIMSENRFCDTCLSFAIKKYNLDF